MVLQKLLDWLEEARAAGDEALIAELEAAIALLQGGGTATPQSGGGNSNNPPPKPGSGKP